MCFQPAGLATLATVGPAMSSLLCFFLFVLYIIDLVSPFLAVVSPWRCMSGLCSQYRIACLMDDWLMSLGPRRLCFGGGCRLSSFLVEVYHDVEVRVCVWWPSVEELVMMLLMLRRLCGRN